MTVPVPLVQPFAAIRPRTDYAADVAAPPYDVVSFDEAVAKAKDRPRSFLHVSRAEIDLPAGTEPYDATVYAQAANCLLAMIEHGILIRDPAPCYYVYRMSSGEHVQTGIAAAASVRAYLENRVRKHEHTRPAKEADRVRQIHAVGAHTGPVMTAHAADPTIGGILEAATSEVPVGEAVVDGTCHQVWPIGDAQRINTLSEAFENLGALYIADGHHRSAAAARVAEARAEAAADPLIIDQSRFLVISFPADSVKILDYNRVVSDLNGSDEAGFLDAVRQRFDVTPVGGQSYRPTEPGTFGMVLGSTWYRLRPLNPPSGDRPAVERLDVAVLNDHLLAPILGIDDPRSDVRIDFVGGSRGLEALQHRVANGAAVAFSMVPTSLHDVMAVADAGDVMPPKSTWFDPKLADGLLSLAVSE